MTSASRGSVRRHRAAIVENNNAPAAIELPAPASLAGLYLAHMLDVGADHTLLPRRAAKELRALGWLVTFDECAFEPVFGWGFLTARSILAARFPGVEQTDPDTGRQRNAEIDEFIDDAFLAAEG